jgi:hypothetical protein
LELQLSSNLLEGPSAVQKQTSASLEPKVPREPNFWIREQPAWSFQNENSLLLSSV